MTATCSTGPSQRTHAHAMCRAHCVTVHTDGSLHYVCTVRTVRVLLLLLLLLLQVVR